MRYLAISDVHAGDPRLNQARRLTCLLAAEEFDALLLVGDIADFWAEYSALEIFIMYRPFFESVRFISHTKSVIWILGNHDPEKYEEKIRYLIPRAEVRSSLIIDHNNYKRCLVIHGHQMERGLTARFQCWLKLLVWKLTRIDLQKFFGDIFGIYRRHMNKIQEKFVASTCSGKYNRMIIGHTHIPLEGEVGPVKYVNCGDWVEHSTYARIINGEISLHEWRGP
jgi:UDP-2,3-diacylglucosamine pyrophosphatase LpxH